MVEKPKMVSHKQAALPPSFSVAYTLFGLGHGFRLWQLPVSLVTVVSVLYSHRLEAMSGDIVANAHSVRGGDKSATSMKLAFLNLTTTSAQTARDPIIHFPS